jgi:hypothetical protein
VGYFYGPSQAQIGELVMHKTFNVAKYSLFVYNGKKMMDVYAFSNKKRAEKKFKELKKSKRPIKMFKMVEIEVWVMLVIKDEDIPVVNQELLEVLRKTPGKTMKEKLPNLDWDELDRLEQSQKDRGLRTKAFGPITLKEILE